MSHELVPWEELNGIDNVVFTIRSQTTSGHVAKPQHDFTHRY